MSPSEMMKVLQKKKSRGDGVCGSALRESLCCETPAGQLRNENDLALGVGGKAKTFNTG